MSKAKSRQCTALGLRLGVPKVDVIGYVFRVCAVARGTWAGPGVNEGPIQSNRTRPAVRAVLGRPRGARVRCMHAKFRFHFSLADGQTRAARTPPREVRS